MNHLHSFESSGQLRNNTALFWAGNVFVSSLDTVDERFLIKDTLSPLAKPRVYIYTITIFLLAKLIMIHVQVMIEVTMVMIWRLQIDMVCCTSVCLYVHVYSVRVCGFIPCVCVCKL